MDELVELPKRFRAQLKEGIKASNLFTTLMGALVFLILAVVFFTMTIPTVKKNEIWIALSCLSISSYLVYSFFSQQSRSYKSLEIAAEGLKLKNLFFGMKVIPWIHIKGIYRKSIQTTQFKLPIEIEHSQVFFNQLRREYYSDVYRPLIKPDFVDVENLPFDDDQLNQILLHLYHRGWSHSYEFVDLLENTTFYDNGQNAKCIQATAVLHFLRQGQEAPRYLKLITDVRGALELLVLNLPVSLRESIPTEFLKRTPEIYSENTFIE
jgi:hypothetical protein